MSLPCGHQAQSTSPGIRTERTRLTFACINGRIPSLRNYGFFAGARVRGGGRLRRYRPTEIAMDARPLVMLLKAKKAASEDPYAVVCALACIDESTQFPFGLGTRASWL